MGSFCKSGPSKTESSSSSSYTPAGLSNLNDIYGRVRDAASTPYTPYTGQMVAGLNQTQQGGINNITGATSYLDTARDYATSGAAPISEGDIARYYNPFQRDVIEATQRNFAEGNAQQDERLKGNAIAAGAWGGDRAGIARSELMRQQKIAQDPVIAGMNSQGFNLALSAAQADRAAKAQGGYQFGALGNAALAQGQSQIGAGSLEQGTEQQRLNALYQQYQQAQAFPYQQAAFMSQYGLPASTAMGGTQTGQSTQQQFAAQPSGLQTAVGIGQMALGAFSGNPMMMMGGMNSMGGGGGGMVQNGGISTYSGSGPFYAAGGRVGGYNHGGRVRPRDHTGFADTVQALRQSMRRGGAVMDMERNPSGIYVPKGYADGGDVGFDDRFGAANDAIMSGEFDPQGANYYDPSTPIASVPMPLPRPQMADIRPPMTLPPQITNQGGAPIMMPADALAYDTPRPTGALRAPIGLTTNAPPEPIPSSAMPPFMPGRSAPSGGGLSEEARMGLIASGLATLASRNPSGIGAIGEGGLAGIKVYTQGKQSKEKNELAARKLIMDAEQFSKGLDLRERAQKETERAHRGLEGYREETLARGKFTYLGPSADGTKSIFMDQKTGAIEEREVQIGAKPTAQKDKPLPSSVLKDLGEKGQAFSTLNDLHGSFNKDYAGYKSDTVADLMNEAARRGLPSMASKDAAEWWQNYDRYKSVVRNKLFGSALTSAEIAQWNKFDAKPSQDPEVVKRNINQQKKIVEKGLRNRVESLSKQGYSKAAIEAEVGLAGSGDALASEKPDVIPPPDKREKRVYQTPKGPMLWTGAGWVKQ